MLHQPLHFLCISPNVQYNEYGISKETSSASDDRWQTRLELVQFKLKIRPVHVNLFAAWSKEKKEKAHSVSVNFIRCIWNWLKLSIFFEETKALSTSLLFCFLQIRFHFRRKCSILPRTHSRLQPKPGLSCRPAAVSFVLWRMAPDGRANRGLCVRDESRKGSWMQSLKLKHSHSSGWRKSKRIEPPLTIDRDPLRKGQPLNH